MNFKKLEAACKALNITEVEIYHIEAEGSSISTFDGAVDQNVVYSKNEMYVRGVCSGHIASLYIERDADAEIDNIVRRLIANAGVIESEDPYFIYGGSDKYPPLPAESHDYDSFTQADKIALCRKMEQLCKDRCEFVSTTEAAIDVETETITIENSNGLSVSRTAVDAVISCAAVIKKDGDVKQGYYVSHVKNLADIDYDKLYERAVERPLSAIGAKSMASGQYPVVFENKMFASLLGCFLSMFSADAVIKKLSLLGGKVGEKVFGDNVTLVDDPLLEQSYARVTFDDEGVAAFKKTVVEKGVLKTYLHNLKTAKMLNAESTGNGFKEGSGAVGVRPSNFCLVPDEAKTHEELLAPIADGVYITQMMGQHAGVNAVSGAFNLQASGYRIRNGKLAEPVTLIVVSGNILDLMNSIEGIADDFEVNRLIGCGSVRVKSLSISGQN
ncbi:MAG: TldD/PmbA family protein [Clostridia bacterium]|nr:TldD/PmbA family protein [Clostridia bacterium]